jgi:RNA polymerase sigma factor (sigma-70 family)
VDHAEWPDPTAARSRGQVLNGVAPSHQPADDQFHRLLREYGPAIERLASAHEPDPNERQDLMQDIVFALWRALPAFRGDCSEKTFVYRIAQNRGLTHRWRRSADTARLVELSDVSELPDPASEPEPPGAVLQSLQRDLLLSAVQQLPGLQRDVIVLSLEGLSNKELAEVLGISEGNVAVRLTRARAALRALCRHLTRTDC